MPYSHKFANAMDTLTAARCLHCGGYSIIRPYSMPWLYTPEIIVAPVALVAWLFVRDWRLAAQIGVIMFFVVLGVAARHARLAAFCPEEPAKLERRRIWELVSAIGILALCLSATLLIPVKFP